MTRIIFLLLIAVSFTSANAASYTYIDRGITYTISDDNPLLATVTFAGLEVNAPAATTPFTFVVNTGSFGQVQISGQGSIEGVTFTQQSEGPYGLDVSPTGIATPVPDRAEPIQVTFSGAYSLAISNPITGETTETQGIWSETRAISTGLPSIDVFDYPNSTSLLGDFRYGASFSLFDDELTGLFDSFPPGYLGGDITAQWITDHVGNTSFAITSGVRIVPIPAAAWLFGSALLGLLGITRR